MTNYTTDSLVSCNMNKADFFIFLTSSVENFPLCGIPRLRGPILDIQILLTVTYITKKQRITALNHSSSKKTNRQSQLPLTTSKGRGFIEWNK